MLEPLTSKESSEVAKSFEKIYSRKLKWPVEDNYRSWQRIHGTCDKLDEET